MIFNTIENLEFKKLPHPDPYLEGLAQFEQAETDHGWIVRVSVEPQHCNGRNLTHGGFIATLVDVALAYGATYSETPPMPMVTVHKSIDFLGPSFSGDTLYATIAITKKGKTMVFAQSQVFNNEEKVICHATGIMQILRFST